MDNRSRGFRLAAAAVMLVFLLAVSAFAMAEADPIRVSSLSEPQSVISEQDVSITIKIYNSSQTDMTEEISLYDPTGGVPVSTYNGLQGEQSVTYTGTWHVTQDQIKEGKIKYYIQYSFDSGNGLDKVVRAVPVTIQTEAAAPQLTATYTLSPTSARKGQKVAVEYTLSNTGNIELRNIAISNEGVSSKKLTAPSLSVGEKVTLQDSFTMGDSELVSKPTVTYQASGESKTYTISDMARKTVTLAQDGLEAALTTDAGDNVYPGEKIHLKLSIKNTGNNGYTGLTATLSDGTVMASDISLAAGANFEQTIEWAPAQSGAVTVQERQRRGGLRHLRRADDHHAGREPGARARRDRAGADHHHLQRTGGCPFRRAGEEHRPDGRGDPHREGSRNDRRHHSVAALRREPHARVRSGNEHRGSDSVRGFRQGCGGQRQGI